MQLQCESFVKDVLPTVRAMIARDLIQKYDMTQKEAAERLDMTQPAISQYKNKLRGNKTRKYLETGKASEEIEEISKQLSEEKMDMQEFTERICNICHVSSCN